jgi:hypothetical protein
MGKEFAGDQSILNFVVHTMTGRASLFLSAVQPLQSKHPAKSS